MNNKKNRKPINIVLFLFLVVLNVTPLLAVFGIDVIHENVTTNGHAQGVAVQEYYAYIANGSGGLVIVNMSNPHGFITYGRLAIPGGQAEQVAVDGDLVVLTDTSTTKGKIHFIDVRNKMRPRLLGTLTCKGSKPRRIALLGRVAFVVENGDTPTEFSGIEVFSCYSERPRYVQLTSIRGVRDLAVSYSYLFAALEENITAYRMTPTGFDKTEVQRLALPAGENLDSIVLRSGYLFAFGNQLTICGPILPEFSIVFRFVPFFSPFPGDMLPGVLIEFPLELRVTAQETVPGDTVNRRIDAAMPLLEEGVTTSPEFYILLTTHHCYGMYKFNYLTRHLEVFEILMMGSDGASILFDVHAATDGTISINDAVFPDYFAPGFFRGGVMGVGAIGNNGLGYVYLD